MERKQTFRGLAFKANSLGSAPTVVKHVGGHGTHVKWVQNPVHT
jgi:hypothetical protein